MRKLVLAAVILLLTLAEVFVLQQDYWIVVNPCYAIYNDPEDASKSALGFGSSKGKTRVFGGVTLYQSVGQCNVAGQLIDGQYFLARDDGSTTRLDSLDALQDAFNRSGFRISVELRGVSRFSDPTLLNFQCIIVATVMVSSTVYYFVGRK